MTIYFNAIALQIIQHTKRANFTLTATVSITGQSPDKRQTTISILF